jgi:hypothetical protein
LRRPLEATGVKRTLSIVLSKLVSRYILDQEGQVSGVVSAGS